MLDKGIQSSTFIGYYSNSDRTIDNKQGVAKLFIAILFKTSMLEQRIHAGENQYFHADEYRVVRLVQYGPCLAIFVFACVAIRLFDIIWNEFVNKKPKLILLSRMIITSLPGLSFGLTAYFIF